jgi:hypothetical protein
MRCVVTSGSDIDPAAVTWSQAPAVTRSQAPVSVTRSQVSAAAADATGEQAVQRPVRTQTLPVSA